MPANPWVVDSETRFQQLLLQLEVARCGPITDITVNPDPRGYPLLLIIRYEDGCLLEVSIEQVFVLQTSSRNILSRIIQINRDAPLPTITHNQATRNADTSVGAYRATSYATSYGEQERPSRQDNLTATPDYYDPYLLHGRQEALREQLARARETIAVQHRSIEELSQKNQELHAVAGAVQAWKTASTPEEKLEAFERLTAAM